MFRSDEFFERFIKWILYKYFPALKQNKDEFFKFIKESFSNDDNKNDRNFLEDTFRGFAKYESEAQKKNLRKVLQIFLDLMNVVKI